MKKNIINHSLNIRLKEGGFSSILLIVIVFTVTLLFASSTSFLSMDNLESSVNHLDNKKSLYLAESCLELVLKDIQSDNSLVLEDYSLILEGGSCIINTEGIDGVKKINIVASRDGFFKKIEAEVLLGEKLSVIKYAIR